MRPAAVAAAVVVVVLWSTATAAAQTPEWREWDLDVPFLHAGNPEADASYAEIMGSGACVFDYDGDGWEDLLLVNGRYADVALQEALAPVSALYRNVGGAAFALVPGVLDLSAWGMGCATGDYDGDGDLDVAINTWGSGPLLFRNDGGVSFANVTSEAGVAHAECGDWPCFGASIAWLDHDKDADLDLYVTNYLAWDGEGLAAPWAYPGQCNVLFRNDGDGTFTNVTEAAGAGDCGRNHLALGIADVDGDGWQDIYVASDETENALLINNGDGTFRDEAPAAGVEDTRGGMGAAWGDYDEDGRYDLVITHFEGETFALHRQGENLTFEDRAGEDGLYHTRNYVGWGAEFVDLDADGRLDLVLVNGHVDVTYSEFIGYGQRDLVLRNVGGRFVDVTNESWSPRAPLEVSRGFAAADFDADGYLDAVVVNNANESARVWRSERGHHNWLTLRLSGNATVNPQALGAVVTVTTPDAKLVREVVAATSYLSQSTRDLHFGLANASTVTSLVVTWPDGTTQGFEDVDVNQALSLDAGGALTTRRAFPLAGAPAPIVNANRVDAVVLDGVVARAPSAVASTSWIVDGESVPGERLERVFGELGAHAVRFRVEDESGGVDEAETLVTVLNLPPEARVSAPATVSRGDSVTLDASGSLDRDGAVTNWSWRIGGDTLHGEVVAWASQELGEFVATLTARDSDGGEATATATIRVVDLPPVADPGRAVVGNPDTEFVFDAGGSHDPDGDVVSWEWDFGDGSGAACDADGCAPTVDGGGVTAVAGDTLVRKRFDAEGVFTVTLSVTDDAGGVGSATTTATVDAAVTPPEARIVAPASADRVSAARFDAGASADADGGIVLWEWELGDGARFACGDCGVVEHTFGALGAFVVNVTVVDADGAWSKASATVRVENLPPRVALPPPIAQEGLGPVILAASGEDPEGRAVAWSWDSGDGSDPEEGARVQHAYSTWGRYEATVTATDDEGASASATVPVWLYARPVAAIAAPPTGDRVTAVDFDGSSSSDADGRVVNWSWDFGDGNVGFGDRPTHRYSRLGEFVVTLTVRDDDGFTGTTTWTIDVVNLPPVARITAYSIANVDQAVPYLAVESHDPDGDVVSWEWDFGDGATVSSVEADHAFASVGEHVVALRVTDDDGASARTVVVVEVVDWLRVSVEMSRRTYAPTETPRGEVEVLFANGLPTAGAAVDVRTTYRAWAPVGSAASDGLRVYSVLVSGEAGDDGVFAFEAPGIVGARTGVPFIPPTTVASTPAGDAMTEHAVTADAEWSRNAGGGETRFHVRVLTLQ